MLHCFGMLRHIRLRRPYVDSACRTIQLPSLNLQELVRKLQHTLLQCVGFQIILSSSLLFGGGTPVFNVSSGYFALSVDFGRRRVELFRKCLLLFCQRDLGLFDRRFGQCVKQTFRVSSPAVIWGGVEGDPVQRPPEALRHSLNFFLSYFSSDHFSFRI